MRAGADNLPACTLLRGDYDPGHIIIESRDAQRHDALSRLRHRL